VLSIPAILLFAMFPGPWAFGSAVLIGFLAASTAPLMLLMAQQLMARRAGLASGLVMGLGFVTGAVGVPITGALADRIGLQNSFMSQALIAAATIGLAWFLPSEKKVDQLAAAAELEPSDRAREATPAAASPAS
jgi:FSR family fosmidomycin resistance protein-like MFS transporter